MIVIFSYNRPDMLMTMLMELAGNDIIVIDDGSDYDASEHAKHCTYYRTRHKGKPFFWTQWRLAFELCQDCEDDSFLFLPDDLSAINMDGIETLRRETEAKYERYCLNIISVGDDKGWTPAGYVDGAFITNRATLSSLEWRIDPVDVRRFAGNNISSGVGQQLSERLFCLCIPMLLPKRNYARHGDHESMMHPIERRKNPLVTI